MFPLLFNLGKGCNKYKPFNYLWIYYFLGPAVQEADLMRNFGFNLMIGMLILRACCSGNGLDAKLLFKLCNTIIISEVLQARKRI